MDLLTRDDGKRTRTRLPSQERHEQLIEVARRVFAERGYAASAIEEIASRAGVTKPVVYQHFGDKEHLHAVVIDREVRSVLERFSQALGSGDPRTSLEQAADAFLRYIEEEPDGFRVLVRSGPPGTEGGRLPSVLADVATAVEKLLGRELRARGLPRRMAPVLSRALVGMVAMTGQWWLDVRRPRRGRVANDLANLAWNGLRGLASNGQGTTRSQE
ncbi:MAG TPA: TetR/AcrR family transcriptional regulator [Actinomycetota bacterium]|nr:TetR/AcrR family transcriptional regulator [Actinomycetota bacterium]